MGMKIRYVIFHKQIIILFFIVIFLQLTVMAKILTKIANVVEKK